MRTFCFLLPRKTVIPVIKPRSNINVRYFRCSVQYKAHTHPGHSKTSKYCLDLVRKHDYDHYLCTLLLPQAVQPAVWALRAFNVELALVHDLVSEKETGRARVGFWRELLDSVYKGEPLHHPVAMALADHSYLSRHWFTRLLDAREAELSVSAYLSTRDMETYAENTFSSLLYLTLEAAGVKSVDADHAASHLGKAEGIVTLLRAMPYYRAKRRVLLPLDILLRHGASQEEVVRQGRDREVSQALKDAVFDFASLAHSHLAKTRLLEKSLCKKAKRVLLPSVVCESLLKRIQLADFDPFAAVLQQRDNKLPLQLLWRAAKTTVS